MALEEFMSALLLENCVEDVTIIRDDASIDSYRQRSFHQAQPKPRRHTVHLLENCMEGVTIMRDDPPLYSSHQQFSHQNQPNPWRHTIHLDRFEVQCYPKAQSPPQMPVRRSSIE